MLATCVTVTFNGDRQRFEVTTYRGNLPLSEVYDSVTAEGARKVAWTQAEWLIKEVGLSVLPSDLIFLSHYVMVRWSDAQKYEVTGADQRIYVESDAARDARLATEKRERQQEDAMNHLKAHFNGFQTMMHGVMGLKQQIEEDTRRYLLDADNVDKRITIEEDRTRRLDEINRHMIEVVQYIAPQLFMAWNDLQGLDGDGDE